MMVLDTSRLLLQVAMAASGGSHDSSMAPPRFFSSQLSSTRDKAMKELWLAARLGSPELVERLLRKHYLPADTVIPETGLPLLLSVSHVLTRNPLRDQGLAHVMALLVDRGAVLTQVVPMDSSHSCAGNNALHLVTILHAGSETENRLNYLMNEIHKGDGAERMLRARNREGKLPEHLALSADVADELRRQRILSRLSKGIYD